MNKTVPTYLVNCKRYFLVFATMVLVLFTSCAVKAGIKNLTGIPPNTVQNLPKANTGFPTDTAERCINSETVDTPTAEKSSFKANGFLPAALLTAAFLFLIAFRTLLKESKHPLYSNSGKIRSALPLFLEYRKLIVHYAH